MPIGQQAKKGITVLEGVNDPDYQREIGLLLHHGGKRRLCVGARDL
jgi:dUTPase